MHEEFTPSEFLLDEDEESEVTEPTDADLEGEDSDDEEFGEGEEE